MTKKITPPVFKAEGPYMPMCHNSSGIIVIEDDQLRTYARDPDEVYHFKGSNSYNFPADSLNGIADKAAASGCNCLTFFHDYFFGGNKRELELSSPEYIKITKAIADAAAKRGMGIGASVVNPLDLGRSFKERIGVGGQHRTYAEGRLSGGEFRFPAYLADVWVNNKGPVKLCYDKVRLFAFTETHEEGSRFAVVDPSSVNEITEGFEAKISEEEWYADKALGRRHMEISGSTALPGNRVFAVLYMDTPEMDYFHPEAKKYIKDVIDDYTKENIKFTELYSDEMHIQFDWNFSHFGPHEIPTRYMTPNFEKYLAENADPLFADADRALIYMAYATGADAEEYGTPYVQHVIGGSPAQLWRTFRMRDRYFELLQDRVVGMTIEAENYIARINGFMPVAHGHATWQESPTCDQYTPAGLFIAGANSGACQYDYTPDYVYSSTVREAISACYDYFKWNDYFTGGGNDFCECGWFDRDYYGGAMTASMASLNKYRSCYWGSWGFPNEVGERHHYVSLAYGGERDPRVSIVTQGTARVCDVAIIYPKDLTACEERFGSWTTQYGYANFVTADKLIELGSVENGRMTVGGCSYTAILVAFEPFYDEKLLRKLSEFAENGGTVLWTSTPACDESGLPAPEWSKLFGVNCAIPAACGKNASEVEFTGILDAVKPMKVLTGFLPDLVYPIKTTDACPAAYAGGELIGAFAKRGKGQVCYLGCRLRDDQSGESGDNVDTMFRVLLALGAYPGEDNTEAISRESEYFCSRFPNGTAAVCNHTYKMKERWEGGFARNAEHDAEALRNYPYLTPLELKLNEMRVNGDVISYDGYGIVEWKKDDSGALNGFMGRKCTGMTLNGVEYRLTGAPADISFGFAADERIPDGVTFALELCTDAEIVTMPFDIPSDAVCMLNNLGGGRKLEECAARVNGRTVVIPPELRGRMLMIIACE